MKVVIESSYNVRDQKIGAYYSFPVYSDEIEKTLIKELQFLNQFKDFSLEMRITKVSEKSS